MKDFDGRRVLITGSGRGIGRAMALRFARAGAEVVISDKDEDAVAAVVAEIGVLGGKARALVFDVTDPPAVQAAHDRLRREAGPIDVLVNNAGVVFGGPFLEVPLERHWLTYRINVLGLAAVTHAFLPDLIARPEAHLVNVASASGYIGLPLGSTYASSKWAVLGFSESIRLELHMLGYDHVAVTEVCPSYVDTGLFAGANPPRTTRLLTPERLADLTFEAVRRKRRVVRVPWLVKVTPLLKGCLPGAWFDRVSALFGATHSMGRWTGRRTG